MNRKSSDFKLGLFVLGGVVILLAGVFLFAASKIFESKTVEETYVNGSVEGLKSGAQVLLRGVPVGQVTRINFSWNIYHVAAPRYVVVEFDVGNQVALVPPGPDYAKRVQEEIAHGLRARIKSEGLAGATILSLEYVTDTSASPPLPFPWRPRHLYIPSAPAQMSQIISSLDAISGKLKNIDFPKMAAQVQQDLVAVQKIINHVDQLNVQELGRNLNGLVMDLRQTTSRLREFVGPVNEPQNVNLQKIASDADNVLSGVKTSTGKLDRMLANLNESSLNDSLDNIRRASQELQETIHQFQQYPAGSLLGKPPPRARSVEAPRK